MSEVLLKFIHEDTAYLSCTKHGPFKIAGPFPVHENLTFACSQCLSESGEKTLEQMLVDLARNREQVMLYSRGDDWRVVVEDPMVTKRYDASTLMEAVVQAYRDR